VVSGELLKRGWQAGAGPGNRPVTIDVDSTIAETYGLYKQDGLKDSYRLTKLGGILWSWSLGELRSPWNVVSGDLSLVGPRPLLVPYLDRYSDEQAKRLLVPPRMTGSSQVDGRNGLTWE
jgi:lipopolysaccharide/colanic/teichoic acid biosynthesis glycosyltransferase